jgi:ribosomal protein L7/L12
MIGPLEGTSCSERRAHAGIRCRTAGACWLRRPSASATAGKCRCAAEMDDDRLVQTSSRRYALLVTNRADRAERIQLLTETALLMLASGADADQVAKELLRRTDSPISVIKVIAGATGLGLGDAKWVVHRNLSPEVREAAESLGLTCSTASGGSRSRLPSRIGRGRPASRRGRLHQGQVHGSGADGARPAA